MSDEKQFTIHLEHLEGYEFRVRFDLDGADDLIVDEAPPVGAGNGPNPSRMLAVAAANCLSASLLYCVSKNTPQAGSLRAEATCRLSRNAGGRLRIGGIAIRLVVDDALEKATRMKRCLDLFEDFCVVTSSLRNGFPVEVEVANEQGERLHKSEVGN